MYQHVSCKTVQNNDLYDSCKTNNQETRNTEYLGCRWSLAGEWFHKSVITWQNWRPRPKPFSETILVEYFSQKILSSKA